MEAFVEFSQGKLSGSALCYWLSPVKQSTSVCFGMRLLKVSHSPVTSHAPSHASEPPRVPEMSHGITFGEPCR